MKDTKNRKRRVDFRRVTTKGNSDYFSSQSLPLLVFFQLHPDIPQPSPFCHDQEANGLEVCGGTNPQSPSFLNCQKPGAPHHEQVSEFL